MGLIRETFNKLVGKESATISQREAYRRAVVRTGNLDWEGKPIDRNAGRPIAGRPEQHGHLERVRVFLERAGMRIERWSERVPQMIPDRLFDQEAKKAEQAHERRFDESRNLDKADVKQMADFLRDGCVEPPKKRGE